MLFRRLLLLFSLFQVLSLFAFANFSFKAWPEFNVDAKLLEGLDQNASINQLIDYFRNHPKHPVKILVLNHVPPIAKKNQDLKTENLREDQPLVDWFNGEGRSVTAWKDNGEAQYAAEYFPAYKTKDTRTGTYFSTPMILVSSAASKETIFHEWLHHVLGMTENKFYSSISTDKGLVHSSVYAFNEINPKLHTVLDEKKATLRLATKNGTLTNKIHLDYFEAYLNWEKAEYGLFRSLEVEELLVAQATSSLATLAGVPKPDVLKSIYYPSSNIFHFEQTINKVFNNNTYLDVSDNLATLEKHAPEIAKKFLELREIVTADLLAVKAYRKSILEKLIDESDSEKYIESMIALDHLTINDTTIDKTLLDRIFKNKREQVLILLIEHKIIHYSEDLGKRIFSERLMEVYKWLYKNGYLK